MEQFKQEVKDALREGRQPNCPYCGEPLEMEQTQVYLKTVSWSDEQHCYVKDYEEDDPEENAPVCMACGEEEWAFGSIVADAEMV